MSESSRSMSPPRFEPIPRWLTAALLGGVCGLASLAGQSVQAQSTQAVAATPSAARHYQIPGGPLAQVLNQLAQAGGRNLSYDTEDMAGKQSPGLRGEYRFDAALEQVLAGMGLQAVPMGGGGYRLAPSPRGAGGVSTLSPITVSGALERNPDSFVATVAATGLKSDASLLETPQSISVVTAAQMRAQAVQNLNEALRYTAGVRTESNGSQKLDDNLYLRGFQQGSQDTFQDGLRLTTPGYFGFFSPETYGLERVDVLKGPASVLYGQQSPGGLINQVSKRPTADPVQEVQLVAGSYDRLQAAFDLGGVTDDQSFMYRLVGLGRDANTQVDYVKDDRTYIAPSFTWRPNADTQFTLLASYQRNKGDFYAQVPATAVLLDNPNGHIPFSRFLGEPGWEFERSERTAIGYELSHRVNSRVKLEQNLRYSHFNNNRQYLQALGALGNYRTLNRRYSLRNISNDGVVVDNRVNLDFDTGPFSHKALMGFDYLWGKSHWFEQSGSAPSIDIYDPQYGAAINTSAFTSKSLQDISSQQFGLYAQDQVRYEKWLLTAGVRQDWARRKTDNLTTGVNSSQQDNALTWRGGLTYLSDAGVAPYVSYAESFTPLIGTTRDGSPYVPETGRQVEAGVKFQPTGYDSFITLSAYDLRRQNVQTIDPVDTNYSVQTGEVRVRGLELEALASLAAGLDLRAAYSYTDAEITKTNIAGQQGNRPYRVPKNTASLWLDYTFRDAALRGLGVGAGVRYIGSTMGDDANTFKVPSFTLVDAALRYDFGRRFDTLRGLSAAINVSNLFDKYYVPACFTVNACNYGSSRSVIGTLTYRW